MLRIKTKLGKDYVHTLFVFDKWVTVSFIDGNTDSIDSTNLYMAGQNHLACCKTMKYLNEC